MENGISAPVSNSQSTASNTQAQGNAPQGGQNQSHSGGSQPSLQSQGSDIKNLTQAAEGKQSSSPQQPEFFDVKVNGKMVRMSKQEALDLASMSHAAQSRFEEASKMKKDTERFRETAKRDMIAALQDPSLGLSKEQIRDEFEKWYTREFIEPEQLSPDQRRAKELESKLKAYEDAEREKLKKQQDQEQLELTNKQREYLQSQIIDALERSGLPKTKLIASRMAFYMRENMLKGWEAPLDLIVKQVKQERQTLMSGEVGGLEGDALVQYLGDDVVNKIRKWDLQRLREQRASRSPEFTKNSSSSSNRDGYGNSEKMSSTDVTRRLKELRSGKKTF
jgi:hypothetical protein